MVDTQRLRETFQREFDWLSRTRDEVRLQAQLAKAETRSELNRLENTWQRVQDEVRRLGDQAKGPAADIGSALRSLLDELTQGYGRIQRELEDTRFNATASKTITAFESEVGLRDMPNARAALIEAERAAAAAPFVRAIEQLAGQIGARADARAVFAPPVTRDGVTVIPAARVFGGYGVGSSSGASNELGDPRAIGMGGGGGFAAMPIGFIEIDRSGARFRRLEEPLDDWFGVAEFAFRTAVRGAGVVKFAWQRWRRRR
jgi:uncharacterized spore protein YtfJ